MGFGMYPGTGWPVPTPDDFPNFIQFQEDGVNLGGPDADTLNFTGNVSVTRGEGENANVVTVDVPANGSGAAPSASSELLVSSISASSKFDGSVPTEYSGSTVLNPSDDVSWDETTATLEFAREGLYAITVMVRITSGGEDVFPTGFVWYGVGLINGAGPDPTKHPVFSDGSEDNSDRNAQCFTDTVYYNTVEGMSTGLRVYAESVVSPSALANLEVLLNARYVGAGV